MLFDKSLVKSRQEAIGLILSGNVFIDTHRIDKPGTKVEINCNLILKQKDKMWVSRGGYKLDKAINDFKVEKPNPVKELIRKDLRLTVDNPEDLVVCRQLYSKFKHLAPRIPVLDLVKYLDKNSKLKEIIYPLTESGYETMYL